MGNCWLAYSISWKTSFPQDVVEQTILVEWLPSQGELSLHTTYQLSEAVLGCIGGCWGSHNTILVTLGVVGVYAYTSSRRNPQKPFEFQNRTLRFFMSSHLRKGFYSLFQFLGLCFSSTSSSCGSSAGFSSVKEGKEIVSVCDPHNLNQKECAPRCSGKTKHVKGFRAIWSSWPLESSSLSDKRKMGTAPLFFPISMPSL